MEAPTLIGVIGGAAAGDAVLEVAEAVGAAVAEAGAWLVCGGRGGVMEAACRGAAEAGGVTVGILPGDRASEANAWVSLPIVTGIGEARNTIIARTAHALVALDGRWGTLSEIAFAVSFGTPVVGVGTWRLAHDDPGFDPEGAIARAEDAAEAVQMALAAARARESTR